MQRNKNLDLILDNIELFVLLVISVIMLSIDLIGRGFEINTVATIITALLALLALHTVRDAYRREQDREAVESDREILNRLDTFLEGASPKVELVDPRSRLDIWANFEGVYYAWNAPFRLERDTDLKASLGTHANRYRNERLIKAQYVFFRGQTDVDPDREVFERRYANYLRFMRALSEEAVELSTKLETFILNESIPEFTFFIGRQNGAELCILYFNQPPFMKGDMPQWAFLIKEPVIVGALKGMFEEKIFQNNPLELQDILN